MAAHHRPARHLREARPPLTPPQRRTGFVFWSGFALGLLVPVVAIALYVLLTAGTGLEVEKIAGVAVILTLVSWIVERILKNLNYLSP